MNETDVTPSPGSPGRPRRSASTTAKPVRRRRTTGAGSKSTASLDALVSQLIKENRTLKRKLATLEEKAKGGGLGQASKSLTAIRRRVEKALAATPAPRKRRSRRAAAAL